MYWRTARVTPGTQVVSLHILHCSYQNFWVQNSLSSPCKYFRNVASGVTSKMKIWFRIWHFGFELVWSTHPLLENENLAKTWHLDLSWSGVPPPPSKTWPEYGTYVEAGVWRLITVSSKEYPSPCPVEKHCIQTALRLFVHTKQSQLPDSSEATGLHQTITASRQLWGC